MGDTYDVYLYEGVMNSKMTETSKGAFKRAYDLFQALALENASRHVWKLFSAPGGTSDTDFD